MDEFKIDSSLFETFATLYKLSNCDCDTCEEWSKVVKMVGTYDPNDVSYVANNFLTMSIEDQILMMKHLINLSDVSKHLTEKYRKDK